MQVRISKPSLLSTVQDTGRPLYRAQAVPVSGAMDTLSARIANMALGNEQEAAVIEFTYANVEFKCETDVMLAYAGDGAILNADHQIIPAERPVFVPCGTLITLTPNSATGCRTYLAVAGGWDVPVVLGSRSTYITADLGGLQGRPLQAGDVLNSAAPISLTAGKLLNQFKGPAMTYAKWSLTHHWLLPADKKTIRVVPAQEFTWFNSRSIIDFLTKPFTLSGQSNRMGYQLEGERMTRANTSELLSTAVTPGTIQVTSEGNPILLMADCQTTGGYPRIAQVAAVDMPLCGQLKPGAMINFTEISRHEAEMLYIEREQQLYKLAMAVNNRL